MTPEDRYHFQPLVLSVESAIARGESVGQYHHSEVLRLLRAALAAEAAPLDVAVLKQAIDNVLDVTTNDRLTPYLDRIAREYAALRSPDTETAGENDG